MMKVRKSWANTACIVLIDIKLFVKWDITVLFWICQKVSLSRKCHNHTLQINPYSTVRKRQGTMTGKWHSEKNKSKATSSLFYNAMITKLLIYQTLWSVTLFTISICCSRKKGFGHLFTFIIKALSYTYVPSRLAHFTNSASIVWNRKTQRSLVRGRGTSIE